MIAITILLIFLAVMNAGLIMFLVYDSYSTEMEFDQIRKDAMDMKEDNAKLREITDSLHAEKIRQMKLKDDDE
jgi:cell division protein FtsL